VQTTAPDATAWAEVRSLCERIVAGAEWAVRPEARSAFFLP
jgi:hypothetical protein